MLTTHLTRHSLSALSLGLLLLSGCSSGPSTSEIRQAVEQEVGQCDLVELTDFEKVNGVANGDSQYTVQVKYAVIVSPTELNSKLLAEWNDWIAANQDAIQPTKTEQYLRMHHNFPLALRKYCPDLSRNVVQDYAGVNMPAYADKVRIDYTNNNLLMIKSDNGWVRM